MAKKTADATIEDARNEAHTTVSEAQARAMQPICSSQPWPVACYAPLALPLGVMAKLLAQCGVIRI